MKNEGIEKSIEESIKLGIQEDIEGGIDTSKTLEGPKVVNVLE